MDTPLEDPEGGFVGDGWLGKGDREGEVFSGTL